MMGLFHLSQSGLIVLGVSIPGGFRNLGQTIYASPLVGKSLERRFPILDGLILFAKLEPTLAQKISCIGVLRLKRQDISKILYRERYIVSLSLDECEKVPTRRHFGGK